jgi:hypothetical protein
MKRFWSFNLVTLAKHKSTTSSCIDNFRFCLSISKNGRIVRFQWMSLTTKREAPSGRAVLTRTIRKDAPNVQTNSWNEECAKTKPIVLWRLKYRSKKVLLYVLIIWQKHTVNNHSTKLRLKVKFFRSDKNGVVGSKLYKEMYVIPQTPRV